MHTERIKGLVVFIAAIWLGACHDYVYCPCLLQEALSWAPISYSGKQISYVSSQDTIRLDCGAPTFSEQQKLPEENLNHCFIWAYLPITMDTSIEIRFEVQGSMEPQSEKIIENDDFKHIIQINRTVSAKVSLKNWRVAFHMENNIPSLDETDAFMDYAQLETINQWQNQAGLDYDSIFKFLPKENSEAPVLYLVSGYGLVQLEWQDGTVWSLIE